MTQERTAGSSTYLDMPHTHFPPSPRRPTRSISYGHPYVAGVKSQIEYGHRAYDAESRQGNLNTRNVSGRYSTIGDGDVRQERTLEAC